jgi:histidine triad (HIT) family protein
MRAAPLAALALLLASPSLAEVAPGSTPGAATGLTGAYDPANAFARILRGDLKAVKVYEDGQVLAFMNIHPLAPGDLLVIPKQPARNLLDIKPGVLKHLVAVAQRLAKAQAAALHPDGIFLRQNSGEAADQTVFHFHLHVTPEWKDVPLAHPTYADPPESPAKLEEVAAKIRAALH